MVGLGNPGRGYERDRHNVGFMVVDELARRYGASFKGKFSGRLAEVRIGDARLALLKPETFMNDSGRSVQPAVAFFKTPLDALLVVHDEVDLDVGRQQARLGGGLAGHNGLRSTTAHIGNEYTRVRIGIGHPGSKDAVTHYVLGDFAKSEAEWVDVMLDALAASAGWMAKGNAARFQTDVARLTQSVDEPEPAKTKPVLPVAPSKPTKHPAGERASKAQNAIAENLKKWLAGRKRPDGD